MCKALAWVFWERERDYSMLSIYFKIHSMCAFPLP